MKKTKQSSNKPLSKKAALKQINTQLTNIENRLKEHKHKVGEFEALRKALYKSLNEINKEKNFKIVGKCYKVFANFSNRNGRTYNYWKILSYDVEDDQYTIVRVENRFTIGDNAVDFEVPLGGNFVRSKATKRNECSNALFEVRLADVLAAIGSKIGSEKLKNLNS